MTSRAVTEFAEIPLKAGTDIQSPILQDSLAFVLQQPGAQRAYYSAQHESPNVLALFVDWDSHKAHVDFTQSPEYGPFMKNLGAVVDGEVSLTHVAFDPFPPSAALSGTSSPTTEVLVTYYDPAITDAEKATAVENLKKLLAIVTSAEGFTAATGGWQYEDAAPPGKDVKAKVHVAAIGWQSVDAHMKFRETDAFKQAAPLLREAPKLIGTRMFHVHNTDIGEGSSRGALSGQDEVLNPHGGSGPTQGGPKLHSDASVSGQTGSWGTKKTDFDTQGQ